MQQRLLMVAVAILLLAATTLADPKLHSTYANDPTAEALDNYNEVQYDYRYAVDDPVSGVINDRWEHRHGEYVKGAYSVLEPDGRLRIVDYEVDGPKGFHAVIRTQFPALIPGQRTNYRSSSRESLAPTSPDHDYVHSHHSPPTPNINVQTNAAPRSDPGQPSQFILPPPVPHNAYNHFTEDTPLALSSTQFARTYYGG